MSNRNCLKQYARTRIDRTIGQLFIELGDKPFTRLAFANLLHQVRARSSLLRPTGDGSQQLLALTALRNIARHHDDFVNWPSTWAGGEGSVYALVHSLASHLFGYSVPRVLGLVWFGGNSEAERAPRRWFIQHAKGVRFRDVTDLPIKMTRKMERFLMSSPHHLPIRTALRRAEILGLGGEPELVDAVLMTPLATDFEHGDFWRSVMQFFVRHWPDLDAEKVRIIVDYLYAVRIRPREIVILGGTRFVPPPDPGFSLAKRTPASLFRLMIEQCHSLSAKPPKHVWRGMDLPELDYQDDAGEWRILELCNTGALRTEGAVMRHCVAIYWRDCASGRASIWSLRWRNGDGDYEPRVTLEVRKPVNAIVQIRGHRNDRISGRLREIIERWATLAGLSVPEYAW